MVSNAQITLTNVRIRHVDWCDSPIAPAHIFADAFSGYGLNPQMAYAAARDEMKHLFLATPDYHKVYVAETIFGDETVTLGAIVWRLFESGMNRPSPLAELLRIAIAKDARGNNIGSMLTRMSLNSVLDVMRRMRPDATEVTGVVWSKESNTAATRLYSKMFGTENQGQRFQNGVREIQFLSTFPL